MLINFIFLFSAENWGSDQDRRSVGLGPNCLQKLSTDDISLTLFSMIDFPRHVARISIELPILYFKGSHR